MAQQALIEISTLLIFADVLAHTLNLVDPTMVFSLVQREGQWEATLQLGPIHEKVRHQHRTAAVKNLSEVLKLRTEQAFKETKRE